MKIIIHLYYTQLWYRYIKVRNVTSGVYCSMFRKSMNSFRLLVNNVRGKTAMTLINPTYHDVYEKGLNNTRSGNSFLEVQSCMNNMHLFYQNKNF